MGLAKEAEKNGAGWGGKTGSKTAFAKQSNRGKVGREEDECGDMYEYQNKTTAVSRMQATNRRIGTNVHEAVKNRKRDGEDVDNIDGVGQRCTRLNWTGET